MPDPPKQTVRPAGMDHGHGADGDIAHLESQMADILADLSKGFQGMGDELWLARGAGSRQQQGRRAGIRHGGQGSADDVGKEPGPGLHAKISDAAIDEEARIDRKIHRVGSGDLGIEIGLADVEGRPQTPQQGIQLGGFQAGVQRCGDGPDPKAGVIGDRELGPVPQMQSDAITPSQAARDQAAREAIDLGGEARIAPDIVAHDEGGTLGAGFGLVTQSRNGSHT